MLNKQMQEQLKRETSFSQGIDTLLSLRHKLMEQLFHIRKEFAPEAFYAMPFPGAKGYHSKTIAYSIWHIFRIEDIVAHTLIKKDEEIFFKSNYQNRIGASIITTGNELKGQQIVDFSKSLHLDELYQYITEVKKSTDSIVRKLSYQDLKRGFDDSDKDRIRDLYVVSSGEEANGLIDYWCGKDIRGLIQMPFSRHWIMHIEAIVRIENKLRMQQKRQVFHKGFIVTERISPAKKCQGVI